MYKIKLSPYHQIFYREWKIDPHSSKYNIVFDQTISSALDINRLETCLCDFILDHVLLNSHVSEINNECYWVRNNDIKPLQKFNSCSMSDLYNYVSKPFDLNSGVLYRFAIFNQDDGNYRFVISMHHIIMDAISGDVFLNNISDYYNNNLRKNNLNLQIEHIKSTSLSLSNNLDINLDRYKNFWNEALLEIDTINLKFLYFNKNTKKSFTEYARPIKQIEFQISKNYIHFLSRLKKKYNISYYMYSQCIFALLLYKYTGQNKFAIPYPVAIKNGIALESGAMVNTIFVVYDFSKINTVIELFEHANSFIKSIKNEEINCCYCPIYDILRGKNKELLDIVFAQTNLKNTSFSFANAKTLKINHEVNIDLSSKLSIEQELDHDKLNFRVKYVASQISDQILKMFINHYKQLFKNILKDLKNCILDQPIASYQILTKKEYDKIVYKYNEPKYDYLKKQQNNSCNI